MTSKMYSRDDCMIKLIIAKLIIFQIFANIINQFVQSYTHFEIYSKIWICWIQSKIWCWRDQTDRFRDLSNFDDRIVWYNLIEIRLAMLCWSEFWMFYNNEKNEKSDDDFENLENNDEKFDDDKHNDKKNKNDWMY